MATNPTLITTPFAESGDKTTPPNTNTPSDGRFSQTLGFPPVTAIPLGSGGKAPKREDFNGAFNMLANIAFYAQKGFTFNWDNSQAYYAGCRVIDSSDGNLYVCISDVAAGQTRPMNNFAKWKKASMTGGGVGYNTRDVVTTSGTYTAPVDGWYKITVKGGGGGGSGGDSASPINGGSGGGEGGITIGYEYMTAGDTAAVTIGAGGSGGAALTVGTNGGNSSVVVNGNTYTGGGGYAGTTAAHGGIGGTGTIPGAPGASEGAEGNLSGAVGGNGGGNGGAPAYYQQQSPDGINGGGGAGGSSRHTSGSAGGDGYVWFEYFAEV